MGEEGLQQQLLQCSTLTFPPPLAAQHLVIRSSGGPRSSLTAPRRPPSFSGTQRSCLRGACALGGEQWAKPMIEP